MRFQLMFAFVATVMISTVAAQETRKIEVAGRTLRFFESAPEKVEGAMPLCLVLPPGSGSEREAQWLFSTFEAEARKNGYLLVTPIVTDKQFFEGGEDDLPALFADLEKRHAIDFDRSIVAGSSNGGRSAFKVAGLWPERFAGIATAPGVLGRDVRLHHLVGMPVWMRIGEKDAENWLQAHERSIEFLKAEHLRLDAAVVPGAGHVFRIDVAALLAFMKKELAPPQKMKTIEIRVDDETRVTADLYEAKSEKAPIVLLCHQAGYSRGEYRRIAPRLSEAGFHALAIDQRVGRGSYGVPNASARRSGMTGDGADYNAARPDIEAALDWIKKEKKLKGPVILWGSSYSSALALIVAAERPEVKAVLSFSPGEYLGGTKRVETAAGKLKIPTLIVSPESERGQARGIVAAIPEEKVTFLCEEAFLHGSKTLEFSTLKDDLWTIVLAFLDDVRG